MKSQLRFPLIAALAPIVVLLGCPGPRDPEPVCGNGATETGEVCDDGNTVNGDECAADCKSTIDPELCGNGQPDQGEECDDGDGISGNGCENDCTKTPTVTTDQCTGAPAAPEGASCVVTPGSDSNRVIYGTILAPGKVFVGGQVLFDAQGAIQCVGCNCDGAATATQINCVGSVVSPGLINSHDHITYQADPYVAENDDDERYEHRHDWRVGGASHDGHNKISNGGNASGAQVTWAELRQLMSGTTAMAGAGSAAGLVRNLDDTNAARQEGLGGPVADSQTFPLNDSDGREISNGCEGYKEFVKPRSGAAGAYLPHIAEGVEASARNEWMCISTNSVYQPFMPRAGVIHGIGMKAADVGQLVASGAGLIWSPRSNIALYGDTAPISLYKRMGARIALGTDWVRSGSMHLLRELKCAADLNRNHFGQALTDEELWRAVTSNPADILQAGTTIGRLAEGRVADIAIFKGGDANAPYRAVIDAETDDVVLTLRGGKALYGDEALVKALNTGTCETLDVCGVQKAVCIESEIGKPYSQLATENASTYPLFDPACGAPAKEPTCTPSRSAQWAVNGSSVYSGEIGAGDKDGDGVADDVDLCPNVFSPIRPLDNGTQADGDGDGVGDACDVCPLDANSTTCTPVDTNDTDGDGVANDKDNCPADANPTQDDNDGDLIGDVCDACAAPNPGNSACPTTIYSVKNGTSPVGQKVSLGNVLVTGVGPTGFFVQVHPSDNGYTNENHSGLFVFSQSPTIAVGDRVDIAEGTVTDYFGQIQLGGVSGVAKVSGPHELPAPIVVTPGEINSTGSKKKELEGVLVQVNNVSVTDVAPALGPGDKEPDNEFVVSGDLRVNDYLYLVTPFPAVGEVFTSITGIVEWRNDNMKLEPRNAQDLVAGSAVLVGFGPANTYARVGQTDAPTIPEALTVTLSRAPATDTFVAVSSPLNSLVVAGGGVTVPAGQSSAPVLLRADAQEAKVTLTASLPGGTPMTADVRVLGLTETAALDALTAEASAVGPGSSLTFTVSLDIPAATDTTVDLAVSPITAGTLSATTVTVPANQKSATFTFTADANFSGSVDVSATLGAVTRPASITVQNMCTGAAVVISQVYGGGGNSGSVYKNDFIELHNRGASPVDISGWSVQYASATGSTWQVTEIPVSTMLQPGAYFLIAQAAGTGGTQALPTPEVTGTIAMGGSQFKVALANSATALSGSCPTGGALVDFVGVGGANCSEGNAPTPAASNSTAMIRNNDGCSDSDNNAADFAGAAANPRNTASATLTCGCN